MKPFPAWRLLPLSALLTLCVCSCKKNDNAASTPATQSSTETLLMNATNAASDGDNVESDEISDVISTDSSNDCRTVTFDTSKTVYPHVRTIDYGSGCTGEDGITRKGKRITTFYASDSTAAPGTMVTQTTFENYYVGDINITGTVTVYIDSSSTADTLKLKMVANRTLTSSDGDLRTINGATYWKMIAGNNTTTRHDNVWQITGSLSGNETLDGATQITWTSLIDAANPVIKPVVCDHRTQGAMDIQLNITTGGNATFTEHLDYGNGACDNAATLSINGGTAKTITLPLEFFPLSL